MFVSATPCIAYDRQNIREIHDLAFQALPASDRLIMLAEKVPAQSTPNAVEIIRRTEDVKLGLRQIRGGTDKILAGDFSIPEVLPDIIMGMDFALTNLKAIEVLAESLEDFADDEDDKPLETLAKSIEDQAERVESFVDDIEDELD